MTYLTSKISGFSRQLEFAILDSGFKNVWFQCAHSLVLSRRKADSKNTASGSGGRGINIEKKHWVISYRLRPHQFG